MATALDSNLEKKEFWNWLKGAISVLYAKEGLCEFVKTEISNFQKDMMHAVITQNGITPGTTCNFCTTANVLNCPSINFCSQGRRCDKHDRTIPDKTPNIQCRTNLCNAIKDFIRYQHRYNQPSWKNSDATRWCFDAFEVAKCFMPPDGYSGKSSLADTDFNGIISIIINNKGFQNKMTAQLNTQQNICSKVRDMINENIRHSGSNELSDIQLARCIDALRDLLQDSRTLLHDQYAKAAVNKINQIQNNTLIISSGDITKAMEENIRICLSKQQTEALDEIRKSVEGKIKEVYTDISGKIKEILQLQRQQSTHNDDILLKDFQEELVRFYNKKESMIPVSPLVEEYAVPLKSLYVQPPMSAFMKPNAFGQGNKPLQKKQLSSYRELFTKDDVLYKDIYVEANAGYGKTSFTQKLTITWCDAQNSKLSIISKVQQEEVDTLKRFDLLFLLHLRDFQGKEICLLDDLVFKFVAQHLPGKEQFSKEFIVRMLQNKTCLAILDGLDEWVHPETCAQTPGIPHNNYRENCTVLTTTRPWKMSTIGLLPNLIDQHIEISEFDDETVKVLKANAVKLLCQNSGEKEQDLGDFDRKVSLVKLGDIRLIPYILLQLICIWFDGLSIGNTKCETYSNSIELTLKRGLKKTTINVLPTENCQQNVSVPECMRHNTLCNQYINLLLKLGKLAFYTLFQEIKETSLVIENKTVLKFLTEQELEFCLKIGLLSQNKDTSKSAEKNYKVFFQHKSIQEFISAFYITNEWKSENVKLTIQKMCPSLSSILEMSPVFIFVCGMNTEVYTDISGEFQKIVEHDNDTRRYRKHMYSGYNEERTMKLYQSMQVQCFQESVKNGNKSCTISLSDVVLDSNLTEDELKALKRIQSFNKGNVKSLQLALRYEKQTAFMESVDRGVFTSLETLRVLYCYEERVWLADILTESVRTLKRLTLSLEQRSLSDINLTKLPGMTCLQSLYLDQVTMAHGNLELLYACISQTTTLKKLKLRDIDCLDHTAQYHECVTTLNLRRLNKLKTFHLNNVPYRQLQVDHTCLEKLRVWPRWEMTTSSSLWEDLREAQVLLSTELINMASCEDMIQTIPTLKELRYLKLRWVNMVNNILCFSPAMAKLERVKLHAVTMSSKAWKELFLSLGDLPQLHDLKLGNIDMGDGMPSFTPKMTKLVRVKLHKVAMSFAACKQLLLSVVNLPQAATLKFVLCRGQSREEWSTIVDVIRSTPTLSLFHDVRIVTYDKWVDYPTVYASLSLTRKSLQEKY